MLRPIDQSSGHLWKGARAESKDGKRPLPSTGNAAGILRSGWKDHAAGSSLRRYDGLTVPAPVRRAAAVQPVRVRARNGAAGTTRAAAPLPPDVSSFAAIHCHDTGRKSGTPGPRCTALACIADAALGTPPERPPGHHGRLTVGHGTPAAGHHARHLRHLHHPVPRDGRNPEHALGPRWRHLCHSRAAPSRTLHWVPTCAGTTGWGAVRWSAPWQARRPGTAARCPTPHPPARRPGPLHIRRSASPSSLRRYVTPCHDTGRNQSPTAVAITRRLIGYVVPAALRFPKPARPCKSDSSRSPPLHEHIIRPPPPDWRLFGAGGR